MSEAKAGGGLPPLERSVIKYVLVPIAKVFFNWDNSLKLFQKEVEKIEKLVNSLPKEKLQKRVKIDRVFGIEEHSSDYSVNMTLEHLTIVCNAMMFVIDTLSKEQKIDKEIKIENVKPTMNEKDENEKFFSLVKKYITFIQAHDKKVSKTTKNHPWFVEFNNQEWAVFNYIHTFVHRRQIEAIIKKL